MAELADAPDLGSGVNDVGVQVPSAAPNKNDYFDRIVILIFLPETAVFMWFCGVEKIFR